MRFLQCQGSFEDIGRQVGEACRADIPDLHDQVVRYLLQNTTVGSLRRIRKIAVEYSKRADRDWPQAIAFLRGLAAGADTSYGTIAVIAFSEEIASEFVPSSKCSTLVVQTARGALIGHNEDYEPHYFGKMVLLDATFDGFPRTVGLTYPGQLPNLAGSLNAKGVAIANNSLWPDAQPGRSKQVQHFRASLADDLEEAVEHLAKPPVALTTHYTVAHGPTGQVVSLEISNPATAEENVSFVTVGPEPFCHTNHVLSLRLKAPDPAVVSANHSLARLAKLQALPRERLPRSPEEMLEFLSTNDGVLHRIPEQNETSVTLATVVIRPQSGELWIRDADPEAARRDWHFLVRPPLN
ncbi:MAG TPA: C45 family peptidase [Candidatus Baltobacteraceae bacterium]|nr:C45 family peptidase [Candidatus Baltobacteraceae bacterium]